MREPPGWRNRRPIASLASIGQTPARCRWPFSAIPDESGAAGPREALAAIEAALFASNEPLGSRRLAQLAGLPEPSDVRPLCAELAKRLDRPDSGLRLDEFAGGYQLLTRADLGAELARLDPGEDEPPLNPPCLETLAIVAYRQPICRSDIEAIRGVQSAEALRQLMDRGLLRLAGREETLGRPHLYGTTRRFLQRYGLRSLRELPLAELVRVDDPQPRLFDGAEDPPPEVLPEA